MSAREEQSGPGYRCRADTPDDPDTFRPSPPEEGPPVPDADELITAAVAAVRGTDVRDAERQLDRLWSAVTVAGRARRHRRRWTPRCWPAGGRPGPALATGLAAGRRGPDRDPSAGRPPGGGWSPRPLAADRASPARPGAAVVGRPADAAWTPGSTAMTTPGGWRSGRPGRVGPDHRPARRVELWRWWRPAAGRGAPPPPGGPVARPRPRRAGRSGSRMLDRVRALLAKAESTTFPAEAEALTGKAQELIARHSIDEALLAAAAEPRRPARRCPPQHRRPVRGREGAAGAGGGGGEPVRGGLVRRSRLRHRAGLAGRSGGGRAALHLAAGPGHRRDAARTRRAAVRAAADAPRRTTSPSSTPSRCGSASGCGPPPTRRTGRRRRPPGRSGCCRCSPPAPRRSGSGWTPSSPASPGPGSPCGTPRAGRPAPPPPTVPCSPAPPHRPGRCPADADPGGLPTPPGYPRPACCARVSAPGLPRPTGRSGRGRGRLRRGSRG